MGSPILLVLVSSRCFGDPENLSFLISFGPTQVRIRLDDLIIESLGGGNLSGLGTANEK